MNEQRCKRTICTRGTQDKWVESSDCARSGGAHANVALDLGYRNGRYTGLGQDRVPNGCAEIYNLGVVSTGVELQTTHEYISRRLWTPGHITNRVLGSPSVVPEGVCGIDSLE